MAEDEYINVEDIDKHQRKEKIANVAAKVGSGAKATGQFLLKGVKDLGYSVKHVATEHIAKPIKQYQAEKPQREERAYQEKLQRMERAKAINAKRIELSQQQAELRKLQPPKQTPVMPSMGGSMFGGMGSVSSKHQAMPNINDIFKIDPWKQQTAKAPRVRKHRVKHHKRRAKRKTKAYVVVNNIRYYKK